MRTIDIKKISMPRGSEIDKKDLFSTMKKIYCESDANYSFLTHMYYDAPNKTLVSINGVVLLSYQDDSLVDWFGEESGYFEYNSNYLIEVEEAKEYPDYKKIYIKDDCETQLREYKSLPKDQFFSKKPYHLLIQFLACVTGFYFSDRKVETLKDIQRYIKFDYINHRKPEKKLHEPFKRGAVQLHGDDNRLKIVIMPLTEQITENWDGLWR